MMEVDNIHSTLERLFKTPISAPIHYTVKMGAARCKTHPDDVHQLDYTFFKEYGDLPNNCHFIRQGKKVDILQLLK